jgi:hypothetical protein
VQENWNRSIRGTLVLLFKKQNIKDVPKLGAKKMVLVAADRLNADSAVGLMRSTTVDAPFLVFFLKFQEGLPPTALY